MEKATKEKEQNSLTKTKQAIINAIDENGNGQIDIEDVIIKGLKVPGIRINRADFLQKQLFKFYPQEIIDKAILESPMQANIPLKEIDKIASEVIKFERNCVSGISAALGAPGGLAMVATIPADIAQYYGYMLRATQKLLYLYGFPQIDTDEKESKLDDGTMNTLIICFGVMYGVAGANGAIVKIANLLREGQTPKILTKKLFQTRFFQSIIAGIQKWFGKKLTQKVIQGFFQKSAVVLGAAISGTITYLSFKPCCDKLQKTLQDTILSNPHYKPIIDEEIILETSVEDNK